MATEEEYSTTDRAWIEGSIAAARGYYARAWTLVCEAQTAEDAAAARGFLANARTEIERWQAALEATNDQD